MTMFIDLGQAGCETDGILTIARSWFQLLSSFPATQTIVIRYKGESEPITLGFDNVDSRDAAYATLLEYLQEDCNGVSK